MPVELRRRTTPANSLTKAGTSSEAGASFFRKKFGETSVDFLSFDVTGDWLGDPPLAPADEGKIGGLLAEDAELGLATHDTGLWLPFTGEGGGRATTPTETTRSALGRREFRLGRSVSSPMTLDSELVDLEGFPDVARPLRTSGEDRFVREVDSTGS